MLSDINRMCADGVMTVIQDGTGWQVQLYNGDNKQVTKRHKKEMIDTDAGFQVGMAARIQNWSLSSIVGSSIMRA